MKPRFVPFPYTKVSATEVTTRARRFYELMNSRRTVRDFSSEPVPARVIEDLVRTASTAPSGRTANPGRSWRCRIRRAKRQIRIAAEKEERENYDGRMPPDWLAALEPLGTDAHKPFLEVAPWLVVLFKQNYGVGENDAHIRHYYVTESVGIAAGLFLTAVHHAGLVALTHTPSPMGFLKKILKRPDNETACLLMPIGYPAEGAEVPDLQRKPLDQILIMR